MTETATEDAERSACMTEARRLQEDATYTSKAHYNDASWWGGWHLRLGLSAAVLSGVAGVAALADFEGHMLVTAISAFVVAAISSTATFLNPSQKAADHYLAGTNFNALKDAARQVAELDAPRESLSKLRNEVKGLADRKAELNGLAPHVRDAAYVAARRGIERGEARYIVDGER